MCWVYKLTGLGRLTENALLVMAHMSKYGTLTIIEICDSAYQKVSVVERLDFEFWDVKSNISHTLES